MRTQEEMYNEIDRASEKENNGTGFHGMSYEEGVKTTLEWVLGNTEDKPMDD